MFIKDKRESNKINFRLRKLSPYQTALVCLLALAFLSHIQWFNPFSILTHGDWGYWNIVASKQLLYTWGTWLPSPNLGSVNIQIPFILFNSIWGLLAYIHIGYEFAPKLTLMIPVAILGFYSPLKYSFKLFGSALIAFAVALFYGTTAYFLMLQTGHIPIAFVYAIAPLLLYFFEEAVNAHSYRLWLRFILLYWLASCIEIRITLIVTGILFMYLLIFCLEKIRYVQIAFVVCLFVLMSLFWVLPAVLGGGSSSIDQVANRGLFGNNLFDLEHALTLSDSAWTGGAPNESFVMQPVKVYLWVFPVLVLIAAMSSSRLSVPNRRYLLFFMTIALIGIFLTKQSNEPVTWAYGLFYKQLPGFNLFREASKFYLLTAVGYMGLLGLALLAIKQGSFKYSGIIYTIVVSLAVGVSLINLSPLITQRIGTIFVARHMPLSYQVLQKKLEDDPKYYRTLWVPAPASWGFFDNSHPKVSAVSLAHASLIKVSQNYAAFSPERQIAVFFASNFSKQVLDASSIRYVIVPIRDTANDDNLISLYGNDRQYFINVLNKTSYLKRVNIGTSNLAVYENTSYEPYITTTGSVYGLEGAEEIPSQLPVLTKNFANNFYIPKGTYKSKAGTGELNGLFDTQTGDPNGGNELKQQENVPANTFLYIARGTNDLFYDVKNGVLGLYKQGIGGLKLNGKAIGSSNQLVSRVTQAQLDPNGEYYLGNGSQLEKVDESQTNRQEFGNVSGVTTLYSASANNLIRDPSFEQGLWQKKVQDCNDYDNQAAISMRTTTNNATSGKHSLELQALNHTACTNQQVAVQAGATYLLSFDYGNQGGQKAGYKIVFNDAKHTTIDQDLYFSGDDWRTLLRSIIAPTGASRMTLQVFGYPDANAQNNSITYYDNFRLSTLRQLTSISAASTSYQKIALPAGRATFTYKDRNYPMNNVVPNGSLEQGLWQKKVGDCNNYDNSPQITMTLDKKDASNGKSSLELEASAHTACTGPKPITVSQNATYLFSFDYRSPTNSPASYHISYNDPTEAIMSQTAQRKGNGWHHYVTSLQVPAGATKLSLLVYATPGSNDTKSVVRYDNFKLVRIPDVLNHYYVVTQPTQAVKPPKSITYQIANPTRKAIQVHGATTPFYLAMSEAYDPQWRLELDNSKVNGLIHSVSPFAAANAVPASDHIDLNDFENGWYVDPAQLCKDNAAGCTRNADGSYNLKLVAEYTPQRWFYVGTVISGLTLIGCIGYVIYAFWPGREYYVWRVHKRAEK